MQIGEESGVPQIWMTYDEFGTLMDCDATAARAKAAAMPLDRRRCHDGHTRVKLNASLTELFLDRAARNWLDREVATCAADLFALRDRMAARPSDAEQAPAVMTG
jgi:hypothetical protein